MGKVELELSSFSIVPVAFLYPIVFSTLIDICKEDKADSLCFFDQREYLAVVKRRQRVSVVFIPFVWTVLVAIHDFFTHCITVSRDLPFVTVFCLKEGE